MTTNNYLIKMQEMRQFAEIAQSEAAKKEFLLLAAEYELLAKIPSPREQAPS